MPVAVSTAGVLNGLTVTAIAAGDGHSLAVANGQVFAWGDNANGQLGNGTTTNSNVPVAVSTAGVLNGLTVTAIAAGVGPQLGRGQRAGLRLGVQRRRRTRQRLDDRQ